MQSYIIETQKVQNNGYSLKYKWHIISQVKLQESVLSGIEYSDEGYELRPVAGSNVYIILKHGRLQDEDTCCTSGVRQFARRFCFVFMKNNNHIYQLANC